MIQHRKWMGLAAAALVAGAAPAWAGDSDADFVKKAASGGMMEVELGRHAAQHAASPQVREFGQRMAADHGKAGQELKQAAQRAGIEVPSGMREHEREMVQKLTKLQGAELDEAYMEAMVDDHRKDVEAFREQADEGESEIDRWAARTLPTLEEHLRLAERVEAAVSASEERRMGDVSGR